MLFSVTYEAEAVDYEKSTCSSEMCFSCCAFEKLRAGADYDQTGPGPEIISGLFSKKRGNFLEN